MIQPPAVMNFEELKIVDEAKSYFNNRKKLGYCQWNRGLLKRSALIKHLDQSFSTAVPSLRMHILNGDINGIFC
jgi:hypothetical protein